MDYREYRKKYGSSQDKNNSDNSRDAGKNRLGDYSEYNRGNGLESQTGSVTRNFVTTRARKKRRKTQSKNSASAKIVLASIIALTFVLILVSVLLIFTSGAVDIPDCLARKVIVEAGRSSIKATDFLKDKTHTAEFIGDSNFKLNSIGKYNVHLSVDGDGDYTVVIDVRDTKAPTAQAKTLTIRKGRNPKPLSCVTNIVDATNVVATFEGETDFSNIGRYSVTVVLTDEGGNQTKIQSTVNVVEDSDILVNTVEIEAGGDIPAITDFVGDDGYGKFTSSPVNVIDAAVPGTYSLEINVSGKLYTVYAKVQDTVKPEAVVKEIEYFNDAFPQPMDFFKSVSDETDVTAAFISEPDWSVQGEVSVKIRLTDKGGNYTDFETRATHKTDYQEPTIKLLKPYLECNTGDTVISWKNAVVASDDSGETPTIRFDRGNTNLDVPGEYTVYFTATDKAGNEKTIEARLVVNRVDITLQMLFMECIKPITDEIITPNMTQEQQAKAIYNYLNVNKASQFKYANTSPHDDWVLQAYLSLTGDRTGDCFVYAAIANGCFQYLGYETVMVERSEEAQKIAGGTHWWIMVNYGTKTNPQWYHFDATTQHAPFKGENLYKMTTAQTEMFTKYRAWYDKAAAYWYVYDQSKYPTSATTGGVEFTNAKYKSFLATLK